MGMKKYIVTIEYDEDSNEFSISDLERSLGDFSKDFMLSNIRVDREKRDESIEKKIKEKEEELRKLKEMR